VPTSSLDDVRLRAVWAVSWEAEDRDSSRVRFSFILTDISIRDEVTFSISDARPSAKPDISSTDDLSSMVEEDDSSRDSARLENWLFTSSTRVSIALTAVLALSTTLFCNADSFETSEV